LASSCRSEPLRAGWLGALLVFAGGAARAGEPSLEARDPAGRRVTLAPDGVPALIVHFWASWCPECAEELPGLEAVAARCAESVQVRPVNVGESVEAAEAFRARHGLRLPLLRDPDGRLFRRFASGLPANLIWTREGRRVTTGPNQRAEWEALLAELGCIGDGLR
jgi:thiol-disulfide isomerase/thioredoxin